jgi:hypothetical protein
MDKPFCRDFSLSKEQAKWMVGLVWHRFHEGQRLPPGWTGRAKVDTATLPEHFQQAIRETIEGLEAMVSERESGTQQQLGFSGVEIYAVQVAAYNAAGWEQGAKIEDLTGGIGIQYHRRKGKALRNSCWDGDLLFDKLPASNVVQVNSGDIERHNSSEKTGELIQRLRTILNLGSEIAAWLDQKEIQ